MLKAEASWRIILTLCCCAAILLAPAFAEARAGSSFGGRPSSFGSRGVRSWDYNGAQPLNRGPAGPSIAAPGLVAPAYDGSFFQRYPFLTGLAGGLFGSWLFGHAAGAGETGRATGSMIGTLLWLVIIALLAWWVWRLVRVRAFSSAWPGIPRRGFGPGATAPVRFRGRDVNLADADLQAFQRLHAAIQDAWSNGDLGRLRRLMTPEMLSYFSQELMRNTTRGLRNVVSHVDLLKGELTEAWEEGDRQYATAFLRWRAIDYMLRLGASPDEGNALLAGDLGNPDQFEEVWTFVRRRRGDWLLSAIQQV
jgi:predicted lipid-binding transport protein (Tim44 family)